MLGTSEDLKHRALCRIGTTLRGRYRLTRLIGTGGTAAVFAGMHRNGNPVAIKVLHERLPEDRELEHRFRREALLANRVRHPGAVPVQDDDVSEDGCVFFVMPLLEGETLRARSERLGGRLPLEEVVAIGCSLLDVLAAAHAQGIVHCDIKPENLFLTVGGELRVLDFGIARFFADAARSGRSQTQRRTGIWAGTPGFMAPEQAQGRFRDVDARTDIWCAGATLFNLAAAAFVHEGATSDSIIANAATCAARSLGTLVPTWPPPIVSVIDRALNFERDARWPEAAAMRDALSSGYFEAFGVSVPPAPRAPDSNVVPSFHSIGTRDFMIEDVVRPASDPAVPLASPPSLGNGRPSSHLPRWLRLAVVATVSLALLGGVAFAAFKGRVEDGVLSRGSAGTSDQARTALEAGIQLWKDASTQAARVKFEEATRLDSGLALAHLLFAAAVEYVDPEARTHIVETHTLRARLTAPQAALLDAIEPLRIEPQDIAEAARRFDVAAASYPDDALIQAARAINDLRQKSTARLLAHVRHVDGPLGLWLQARAELAQENTTEARNTLERCAQSSPQAVDCLAYLARLESNEGHCDAAAAAARKLIAVDERSPLGFEALARAELGRGLGTSGVHAILAEKWARTAPDRKEVDQARDEFFLRLHAGKFDEAFAALDTWDDRAARRSVYAIARTFPVISRVALNLELGRNDAAAAIARGLAESSVSWVRSDFIDVPTEVSRALYLTGQIERGEFLQRRAHDEEGLIARGGYFDPAVRWLEAYVQSIKVPEDAQLALEHRPSDRGVLDPVLRDAAVDKRVGLMFVLAGRPEDSLGPLERATRACTLYRTLEQVQALAIYGDVLAAMGRRDAACAAYASVLNRWGRAAQSESVRKALRGAQQLHCATINQEG